MEQYFVFEDDSEEQIAVCCLYSNSNLHTLAQISPRQVSLTTNIIEFLCKEAFPALLPRSVTHALKQIRIGKPRAGIPRGKSLEPFASDAAKPCWTHFRNESAQDSDPQLLHLMLTCSARRQPPPEDGTGPPPPPGARRAAMAADGGGKRFVGPSPYAKRPCRIYDSSLLSDERRCVGLGGAGRRERREDRLSGWAETARTQRITQ